MNRPALLLLGVLAAPAHGAGPDPAATRIEAAEAREVELRRRRLTDLATLARQEPRPSGRSEAYLALAETLDEHARAVQAQSVGRGQDAEHDAREDALRAEDKALGILELLLRRGDALPSAERDRAGFLYAELMQRQGDDRRAERALHTIEQTTPDPRRRARAAAWRGAILGESREEDALAESLAAYTRALDTTPTIKNRLGAASAANRLGETETALGHYAALLALDPARDDAAGRQARRVAAKAVAQILAEYYEPAQADAWIGAQGLAGNRVWLPLGQSYGLRDASADMHRALDRARTLDPEPKNRFDALAALADAALRLGRRDDAAAHLAALGDALAALDPAAPDHADHRKVAESSLKKAIDRLNRDAPDAWSDAAAARLIETWLAHFAESSYGPNVYFARGIRRARAAQEPTADACPPSAPDACPPVAERCDDRRAAAADLRRAYDGAGETWPRLATESGLALVQTLAGCRPADPDLEARPPATALDPALISFADRYLVAEADADASVRGEVLLHLGVARLATADDEGARAALGRAAALDGAHLADAAVQLMRALRLDGDLDALQRRALAFADDPRLPPPLRDAMRERAWEAGYARAAAPDLPPAERAARLLDYARQNPDAPGIGGALVLAAAAFGEAGEYGQARATLESAAAQEVALGRVGDAHLALADLIERQGDLDGALDRYARWLDAPASATDPRRPAVAGLVAARYTALGQPARAIGLQLAALPATERAAARLDAAIEALPDDPERARALIALAPVDRADRPLAALAERCLADPTTLDPALAAAARHHRRRPDPRAAALVAACATRRLEALLTERPPPGATPDEAMAHIEAQVAHLEQTAGALIDLAPALPLSWERWRLVQARLYARYVRAIARVGRLDPEAAALVQGAAADAWATWHELRALSESYGLDGPLSARLGATLGELVAMPAPGTAPAASEVEK